MNQQNTTNTSLFSTSWENKWEDNIISNESELNYKQLSIISLIAFLLGLGSFFVFLTLWFTFIGVLGIIFSLIGILLISRSDGTLTGLLFARFGLCLSVISLVSVFVFWSYYDYNMRYEADQFCQAWFNLFTQENNFDNIPLIKTATSVYWERKDTNNAETWWKKQYENKYSHKDIHTLADNKLFRTMLALGAEMKLTLYKTQNVYISNEEQRVTNIYAITFKDKNDNNATKSFFIKISADRKTQIDNNLNQKKKLTGWSLSGFPEFILPDEFK
ncbi:MAG: hypothetical protein LBP59_18005 [Planctomycetaceae bacterium]|jgi:hypothetical protein|nr:hypothetical protein [Planctomycetaceae bacterium]